MSFLEVVTRNDLPIYNYNVVLDGTSFTLTYTFNDRMGKWFLQLADLQGNVIIAPVPITAGFRLFKRFTGFDVPAGALFAYDTSNKQEDPGRFDLGDRVIVIYREVNTV